MTQDIGERTRAIIAAVISPAKSALVSDAARLIEDLDADSLTFEEIGLALEQEFPIGEISRDEMVAWVMVKDVVDMIGRKLAADAVQEESGA